MRKWTSFLAYTVQVSSTCGQTQALFYLNFGANGWTQIIDGLDPEYKKRFSMHHYNFPQYSVGETGRYGAPGRRGSVTVLLVSKKALAQVYQA